MTYICEQKIQETVNTGIHFVFNDLKLIPKIKHDQFFKSLANSLHNRLFTTRATHVFKNKN